MILGRQSNLIFLASTSSFPVVTQEHGGKEVQMSQRQSFTCCICLRVYKVRKFERLFRQIPVSKHCWLHERYIFGLIKHLNSVMCNMHASCVYKTKCDCSYDVLPVRRSVMECVVTWLGCALLEMRLVTPQGAKIADSTMSSEDVMNTITSIFFPCHKKRRRNSTVWDIICHE